jgi:hypothetical protein
VAKSLGTSYVVPLASAPAVGSAGNLYYNTATSLLNMSNGAAWASIAPLASPTFTGTVTAATLDLTTAATATAATSYWVETGSDGILRPKTLANVKTEIVTGAAITAGGGATDSLVVHLAGTETITGQKSFSAAVHIRSGSALRLYDSANTGFIDAVYTLGSRLDFDGQIGFLGGLSTGQFNAVASITNDTPLRAIGLTGQTAPLQQWVVNLTTLATMSAAGGLALSSILELPASTTSVPPMRIPHGTAPTSPTNGDVWTTTAGMYARINGATVGPFGAGGSGGPTLSDTPPGSPTAGQLWYETDTGVTYIYYDSAWIEIGGAAVGGAIVSDTAPPSPVTGSLWYESDTGLTFVYYDSSWVEVGNSSTGVFYVGDTAPTSPVNGTGWFKSDTAQTFIYYDSTWVEVGPGAAIGALDAAVVHLAGTETITGEKTFSSDITLTKSGTTPSVNLTSIAAASYVPPTLNFNRIGAAGAATPDNSAIAQISFYARNTSLADVMIAQIYAGIGVVDADDVPGRLIFSTSDGTTAPTTALVLAADKLATFTGTIKAPAATTSIPSIRIPHGAAPSAPTDGDVWTTTAGMYARINGTTIQMPSDALVVHLAGTETITGAKTFSSNVIINPANLSIGGNVAGARGITVTNTTTNGYSQMALSAAGSLLLYSTNATSGLIQGSFNMPNSSAALLTNLAPLAVGTDGLYDLNLISNGANRVTVASGGEVTFGSSSYAIFPAATTSIPSIRIPHGAAPSAPTDGDVWTTTAGMYVRINGTTVGPLAAGGAASFNAITSVTGAAATATLWSDVVTGSIGIGQGLTTGALNLATVGTGVTPIAVGHTNATLAVISSGFNLTTGGALTLTSTIAASGLAGSLLSSANPVALGTAGPGTGTIPSRQDHVHPTTGLALLAGATFTGAVVLATGTNALAPLKFGAGPVLTTATAGSVEADGDAAYFTPDSAAVGGRGVLQTNHFYGLSAVRNLTNGTGAQSIFGVGLTVAGSTTYEVEMEIAISNAGATTNVKSFILSGGTATFTSVGFSLQWVHTATSVATSGTFNQVWLAVATTTALGATSTTNYTRLRVRGLVRVNASGTFIPQFAYGAAPGNTPIVQANSFIKMTPVGTNTVTTVGAWA